MCAFVLIDFQKTKDNLGKRDIRKCTVFYYRYYILQILNIYVIFSTDIAPICFEISICYNIDGHQSVLNEIDSNKMF